MRRRHLLSLQSQVLRVASSQVLPQIGILFRSEIGRYFSDQKSGGIYMIISYFPHMRFIITLNMEEIQILGM
jgi:hypothetical protein